MVRGPGPSGTHVLCGDLAAIFASRRILEATGHVPVEEKVVRPYRDAFPRAVCVALGCTQRTVSTMSQGRCSSPKEAVHQGPRPSGLAGTGLPNAPSFSGVGDRARPLCTVARRHAYEPRGFQTSVNACHSGSLAPRSNVSGRLLASRLASSCDSESLDDVWR